MCKMKGKKELQTTTAAVWEVDLWNSLSARQITTYPIPVPFPGLPLRACEGKTNSVNTVICKCFLQIMPLKETKQIQQ